MYCLRCGNQIAPGAAVCGTCGTPVSGVVGADVIRRPGIVTLLAVLQLIGATFGLLGALALIAAWTLDAIQTGVIPIALVGSVLAGLGVAQMVCGIGLLKLRPYGRTLLLVFAWIGLLGLPIGTIVSILILVYLYKPGIKALFSGKQVSEFNAKELADIATVTSGSGAAIALVVILVGVLVVFSVGIVAAIAIPGLLNARLVGNEASAIGSLRAIIAGQVTYSVACADGGYAVTLEDLARPANGSPMGFVGPDLATNGVTNGGYRVTIAKDAAAGVVDTGTAASTCNASTSPPASSYFASAEPLTPGSSGRRYFAADARGIIFQSDSPIPNPIPEGTVVPVQ